MDFPPDGHPYAFYLVLNETSSIAFGFRNADVNGDPPEWGLFFVPAASPPCAVLVRGGAAWSDPTANSVFTATFGYPSNTTLAPGKYEVWLWKRAYTASMLLDILPRNGNSPDAKARVAPTETAQAPVRHDVFSGFGDVAMNVTLPTPASRTFFSLEPRAPLVFLGSWQEAAAVSGTRHCASDASGTVQAGPGQQAPPKLVVGLVDPATQAAFSFQSVASPVGIPLQEWNWTATLVDFPS